MNTNTELFATSETIEVELGFEYVMTKAEKRELQKKAALEKAALEKAALEKAALEKAAIELAAKELAAIELAAKELAAKEAAIELAAKELAAKEAAIELAAKELAAKEASETAAEKVVELDVKVTKTKTIALLELYISNFQSVIESEKKCMNIPPASDFSEFGGPPTFNTTLASLNNVMITKILEFFQTTILSRTHSLLIVISPEGTDPLQFRAAKEKIDPNASNCIHFVLTEKSLPEVTKSVKNNWPTNEAVNEALKNAVPHKDGLTPSVVYTVRATLDELDAQCLNVYDRKYCLTKDQPTDTSKVRFRLFKENKSTWKSMKAVGEKRKESTGGRKKNHA